MAWNWTEMAKQEPMRDKVIKFAREIINQEIHLLHDSTNHEIVRSILSGNLGKMLYTMRSGRMIADYHINEIYIDKNQVVVPLRIKEKRGEPYATVTCIVSAEKTKDSIKQTAFDRAMDGV